MGRIGFSPGSFSFSFRPQACGSNHPGKRRIQMKVRFGLVIVGVGFFGISQVINAQCPQICDPDGNTSLGFFALSSDTTGGNNTAIGFQAMNLNTTGSSGTATGYHALINNTTGGNNTAIGAQALQANTIGSSNTANGASALFSNTTGFANTATGITALALNTTGGFNTATGAGALNLNTTGGSNTASGYFALFSNTTGFSNTATGVQALFNNTIGGDNTATGFGALDSNTTGNNNTAIGFSALNSNTTGNNNTAIGIDALFNNTTGSTNIALGFLAGVNLTTGSNNIYIGTSGGSSGESAKIRIGTQGTQTATFIAGISGVTVPGGVGVIVGTNGKLGTTTSSARYKDNIEPMDKASEVIHSLQPVTFRYKHELDPAASPQFGLVAEEVAKVHPDLVARDEEGKPYTVRYEAVNAMLLNEFLKEHRRIDEQARQVQEQEAINSMLESTVARQQKEIRALTTSL